MKRFICFFLAVLFIFLLFGCKNSISDYRNFYYCTVNYPYGKDASVISSESRDISGHEGELSYLISLYLTGPSSKKLKSPFPRNTKLVSAQVNDDTVMIELSYLGKQLSDSEFVIACACLTLSTMEFTNAQVVSIISGEQTITMDKDDLLLFDTVTAESETEVQE